MKNTFPVDESVEVRFPAAFLTVMTLALLLGGMVTCGLMWLLSGMQPHAQQHTLRAVGTAVLFTDIGMAIFLRAFLGNAFVRADNKGVTKRSGFAREQFVAWDNIARLETQKSGASIIGLTLFDRDNKSVMRIRPEARPPLDKTKIVAFIEKKLNARH